MTEWAIRAAVLLSILSIICIIMMIKSPVNSAKERVYGGLSLFATALAMVATRL